MRRWSFGLVCFVLGLIAVPLFAYLYLVYGNPPVAVADAPFPLEQAIVSGPLNGRIHKDMQQSPIGSDPQTIAAGAVIYTQHCAFCHGLPNHPSPYANNMYPHIPQLWQPHRNSKVVGVSDDPVGETFWKVKNGIRLTGMPAYEKLLSNEQMWQVSQLLANADKPLAPEVQQSLQPTQLTLP